MSSDDDSKAPIVVDDSELELSDAADVLDATDAAEAESFDARGAIATAIATALATAQDDAHLRVTSPAPATTRDWPRFTDDDRTPMLGVPASEFPAFAGFRSGMSALPLPLRLPVLPPQVLPPSLELHAPKAVAGAEASRHDEVTVRPPSSRDPASLATTTSRSLFLPPTTPPPPSKRRGPTSTRELRSEPPSFSNMALSQSGSQMTRVPASSRASRAGWYVSGVLGVLLFMNLFHPRPEPATHAAGGAAPAPAAQTPALPVETEPATASIVRTSDVSGATAASDEAAPAVEPAPALGPVALGPVAMGPAAVTPDATPAAATLEGAAAPAPVVRVNATPEADRIAKKEAAAPRLAVPSDGEVEISPAEAAVAGAKVASERGNAAQAAAQYTRALQANPAFFPASLGLADTQWNAGNKKAAQNEYKRMLATFPPSMIPPHARARASESLPVQ